MILLTIFYVQTAFTSNIKPLHALSQVRFTRNDQKNN